MSLLTARTRACATLASEIKVTLLTRLGPIRVVVDFPLVSGASCARTSDCSESRQVLVMDERKTWTQSVGVSHLFDGFCCCGSID